MKQAEGSASSTDADAPAEVKDVLRRFYMRYSGPAGMTEQDDMENWLYATKASTGTIARRYPSPPPSRANEMARR